MRMRSETQRLVDPRASDGLWWKVLPNGAIDASPYSLQSWGRLCPLTEEAARFPEKRQGPVSSSLRSVSFIERGRVLARTDDQLNRARTSSVI